MPFKTACTSVKELAKGETVFPTVLSVRLWVRTGRTTVHSPSFWGVLGRTTLGKVRTGRTIESRLVLSGALGSPSRGPAGPPDGWEHWGETVGQSRGF